MSVKMSHVHREDLPSRRARPLMSHLMVLTRPSVRLFVRPFIYTYIHTCVSVQPPLQSGAGKIILTGRNFEQNSNCTVNEQMGKGEKDGDFEQDWKRTVLYL